MKMFAMALCAGVAGSVAGQVTVLDFSGLQNGEILNNQYLAQGVTISAINPNRPFDIAAVFDTESTGGPDPDLQGPPWNGGNLAISPTETVLGNAAIIAADDTDANGDGLLDVPNDEGRRPAGTLIFELDFIAVSFGVDIIDIEGAIQETSSFEFLLDGVAVLEVSFSDFVTNGSGYYDPTVSFGNNSANRIASFDVVPGYNELRINAGGSSAYDTLVFGGVVPAPGTAALLGLGGLAMVRRR